MYEELVALGTPMTHNFAVGPGSEDLIATHNKGVTPLFMTTLVPDPDASAKEGRPMFREEVIALLHVAGDPYNRVPMELKAAAVRFPVQYQAWVTKKEGRHIDGTPLREWPRLSSREVAEFEALDIFNVEGLAAISDLNISRHPSLRRYREMAAAFLAQAKDTAAVSRFAEENDKLRRDLEELKGQMRRMAAQYEKEAQRREKA